MSNEKEMTCCQFLAFFFYWPLPLFMPTCLAIDHCFMCCEYRIHKQKVRQIMITIMIFQEKKRESGKKQNKKKWQMLLRMWLPDKRPYFLPPSGRQPAHGIERAGYTWIMLMAGASRAFVTLRSPEREISCGPLVPLWRHITASTTLDSAPSVYTALKWSKTSVPNVK